MIFIPSDLDNWEYLETDDFTLSDYNPARVDELVANVFTIGPDGVGYAGVGDADRRLGIWVPISWTQQQKDAAVATLLEICADTTRNDPTEEEQEHADIDNKIQNMKDAITELAGDDTAVPPVDGIIDLLASTQFETDNPNNAAKIEALRGHLRNVSQDLVKTCRSVRYLLREEKKRQTGVFSFTE